MMPKFMMVVIIYMMSHLVSGCATYKIDIQQGNVVTQEMIDQLELQMPAKKVRFIMGNPLLVDVFHPQRWDYLYSFQSGGEQREQRHIALFFDAQDQLVKVAGDIAIGPRDKQKLSPPIAPPEEPLL